MKQKIILASTSLRRKELLKQIGLDFEIAPNGYEEDMSLKVSNVKLAKTLALGKARSAAENILSGIIIGSDTFIVFNGKRIGKPKDENDARKILRRLSGKTMKIYSGIAVIDAEKEKEFSDYEITTLKLKKMSKQEIESYLKTREPLNKAGAFDIHGHGAVFIKKINGCYSNAVGLPLYKLYSLLQKTGVNIFT